MGSLRTTGAERFGKGAYASLEYALCLGHVGEPLRLERSGLAVIARKVEGTARHDLVGPYPLMPIEDPAALAADLDALAHSDDPPVSFVAVAEPMLTRDIDGLRAGFRAIARPFKRHFVVDPRLPEDERLSKHHVAELRRARSFATFEVVHPADGRADFVRLYDGLVRRLALSGAAAFPAASLAAQLELGGALGVRAVEADGRTTAYALMLRDGPFAWYHLAAQDELGRKHLAGYGALAEALRLLAEEDVRLVDLGAGAGLDEDATDGLAKWKSGFTSPKSEGDHPIAWLVGRVIDPLAYAALSSGRETQFFPRYRSPQTEVSP